MNEYIDQDLNLVEQKMVNVEKNLMIIEDQISRLTESLKETQRYLVKLAYNQQELTKRISQWPYIVVSNRENDET